MVWGLFCFVGLFLVTSLQSQWKFKRLLTFNFKNWTNVPQYHLKGRYLPSDTMAGGHMVLLRDLHTRVYVLIQKHVCMRMHTWCFCCSLTTGFQRYFHLASLRSSGDWKWERKSLGPWETEVGCSLLNRKKEKPLRTQTVQTVSTHGISQTLANNFLAYNHSMVENLLSVHKEYYLYWNIKTPTFFWIFLFFCNNHWLYYGVKLKRNSTIHQP